MSVTNPFPLNITLKVDSPQLLAFLAQFGESKFASASDFNKIFQALDYLYENMGSGGSALFLGDFVSVEALQAEHPSPVAGNTANIIVEFGSNDLAVWDNDDSVWIVYPGAGYSFSIPSFDETASVNPVTTANIGVGGLTITGKIAFVTSLITALRNVSFPDKDGTVAYLDDISAFLEGITRKQPVELNLTSGVDDISPAVIGITSLTQQGVTLVNDSRVIVSGLANQTKNGIYRVNSTLVSGVGGYTYYRLFRTNDANTTAELNNALVDVTGGTHAGKTFRQSTLNPVIGTSNIVFQDFGFSVATATDTILGITKLYNTLGSNLDGTINQKIISDNFALKFNSADICVKSLNTNVTMNSNVQLNTNLTFPIGANETWVIEFVMSGGCTSSGGTRFQVNTPAGSSGSGHVTASSAQAGISVNSPALAVALGSASQPIRLYMTIRNGVNAGNVTLSFASNSPGQTSIVRANSYFIAIKTTIV